MLLKFQSFKSNSSRENQLVNFFLNFTRWNKQYRTSLEKGQLFWVLNNGKISKIIVKWQKFLFWRELELSGDIKRKYASNIKLGLIIFHIWASWIGTGDRNNHFFLCTHSILKWWLGLFYLNFLLNHLHISQKIGCMY